MLNGNKIFITNGTDADIALVFASVDLAKKHKGITASSCRRDTPGYSHGTPRVQARRQRLGHHRARLHRHAHPGPLPPRRGGRGLQDRHGTLDGGRIGIAAQAIGIAQAAFEEALAYAQQREQFGQHLSDFQAIQFYLADMATEIDAARLLAWKAAWTKDEAKALHARGAAQAKLFASEMAQRVTNKALQIHGGYGYTKEYNVERYFRDARITEIYEGTSEIQKLVIAREIFRESGLVIG